MIAIIYRSSTPKAKALALELEKIIRLNNKPVIILEDYDQCIVPHSLPPDTQAILVLGGDGAMLGAVRLWDECQLDTSTPIIGINLGSLGFLTALTHEELSKALPAILSDEFATQERMLLKATLDEKQQQVALNEVVISKTHLASLLVLEVEVDAKYLTHFRADGLIVSTPTGSTAYNLSAGGPICHPAMDCLILTPICSFNLINRPIILAGDMELKVRLVTEEAELICDGQVKADFHAGQVAVIRQTSRKVAIGITHDYFEILRHKLKWGSSSSAPLDVGYV